MYWADAYILLICDCSKVAEYLQLKETDLDLTSAVVLDYYVAAVWWCREQAYSAQQTSAFFSVIDTLFHNLGICLTIVCLFSPIKHFMHFTHLHPTEMQISADRHLITLWPWPLTSLTEISRLKGIAVESAKFQIILTIIIITLFAHKKVWQMTVYEQADEQEAQGELLQQPYSQYYSTDITQDGRQSTKKHKHC